LRITNYELRIEEEEEENPQISRMEREKGGRGERELWVSGQWSVVDGDRPLATDHCSLSSNLCHL
ncbi:MAG TPA: hypothetical protein PLC06_10575, partial [Promineifilum sp.]|nr:hypothetical protein [Promineifilum sp.]